MPNSMPNSMKDSPQNRPDESPRKPRNWLETLNCAIEGILYAFKTQKHVKIHFFIAAVVLALSLFLKLTVTEFVLFLFSAILLLFAELFNTAIEEVVNLVEEKHHETAKNAKDVAAGAVLISSVAVVIMGYVIFTKYLYGPAGEALVVAKASSGFIAVISLLLVLIAVVAAKALTGRGSPLHGGLPSGHAALAFAIWAAVSLITLEPIVVILTFAMAAMVSHSRLIGDIHSKLEVALGALLGSGLTFLVFYLFSAVVE